MAGFTIGSCFGNLLRRVPYTAVAARVLLVSCRGPGGRVDSPAGAAIPRLRPLLAQRAAARQHLHHVEVAGQPEGTTLLEAIEAGLHPTLRRGVREVGEVEEEQWHTPAQESVTGCVFFFQALAVGNGVPPRRRGRGGGRRGRG